MVASLIQFLIAAAVIIVAGIALNRSGHTISRRTGLGGLLVGSILIAGATSLPELATDISAVRMGAADLAVGDLLGSSLFNLLILSVLDLTRYSRGRLLSPASVSQPLAAGASIILTALAALFILIGPQLEGVTFARVGPGSIAIAAAYLVCMRLVYRSQRQPGRESPTSGKERAQPRQPGMPGLKGAVWSYIIAAAAILSAAPFLAKAATDLAELSGLGRTFFGTVFVAFCTSLPEIATTLAAVRMKAFDMALGNILGSNCFNMLIFLPLDVVHEGSLLASVAPSHVYTALAVIIITTGVIVGQLYGGERKRHFPAREALVALVLILCALIGLYFVR